MGGKGSGRPPKPETLIRLQQQEKRTPIATEMFIPNHSGVSTHPEVIANYLKIDGSNANQNIDIGSEDLTTTGTITAEQLTSTDDALIQGNVLTIGDGATATDLNLVFNGYWGGVAVVGGITWDTSQPRYEFAAPGGTSVQLWSAVNDLELNSFNDMVKVTNALTVNSAFGTRFIED